VAVERRGRPAVAFLLRGSTPGASGRLVVDLGKGSASLAVPADAQALPVRDAGVPPTETSDSRGTTPDVQTAPRDGAGVETALRDEDVWVRVQSIDFEGVTSASPTREELLDLELRIRVGENGDLSAAPDGAEATRLTLRELTSEERASGRVGGSVLQQIVQRIADQYAAQGKYGTRIDIQKSDLEAVTGDQPGALRIRIQSPSAP
jgi:hypothetical protein